jgi:hypothetical protein
MHRLNRILMHGSVVCFIVQVNVIGFNVGGFSALKGALTIVAKYTVSSEDRVSIAFESASLVRVH